MTASLRRRLAASGLALALAVAFSAPALAAPKHDTAPVPPPLVITPAAPPEEPSVETPTPETVAMSRHLIDYVFNDVESFRPLFDLGMTFVEAQMKTRTEGPADSFANLAMHRFAAWPRLAGEAVWEELIQDRPAITEILAQYMAHRYSRAELAAAVALMDSPFGKEARTVMMTKAMSKGQAGAFSPEAQAALDRFMKSPEGRRFIHKSETINRDPAVKPVVLDLIAEYLPGVMRRFGEKAEAAEAARKTAAPAG